MYRLIVEFNFVFTNDSFNKRVVLKLRLDQNPSELTGSFIHYSPTTKVQEEHKYWSRYLNFVKINKKFELLEYSSRDYSLANNKI
jgi:hypothetical protein